MRAFVFTDKSLAGQAGRFVWLEIDTEKSKNAALRKRLKIQALPTFFVVDPKDESVALRWVGGATAPQLLAMLDNGHKAVSGASAPPAGRETSDADRALARADRLYGDGDNAEAAKAYQEALAAALDGWAHYPRAVESLLFALVVTEQYEPAVKLAREAYPRLQRTSSAANVAASGLDAALNLPAEHPSRKQWAEAFEADARAVTADTALSIAADDRSGVFGVLLDARERADDEAGAKRVASEWAEFLEREAALATTPDRRTVFDSHRLAAYLKLGEPERAIPMLEASERDFPDDYNPPARLAVTYQAMKHWDEALAASTRALDKAYGPRKLRILQNRADIQVGAGDTGAARRTLEAAVAMAESLPPGQRSDSTIAALKKKLEGLK